MAFLEVPSVDYYRNQDFLHRKTWLSGRKGMFFVNIPEMNTPGSTNWL